MGELRLTEEKRLERKRANSRAWYHRNRKRISKERRKQWKSWYAKNREKFCAKSKRYHAKNRRQAKEILGNVCTCCGATKDSNTPRGKDALQLDHVIPRHGRRSGVRSQSRTAALAVIRAHKDGKSDHGIALLCYSCNRWKNDGPCCPCKYWKELFPKWRR